MSYHWELVLVEHLCWYSSIKKTGWLTRHPASISIRSSKSRWYLARESLLQILKFKRLSSKFGDVNNNVAEVRLDFRIETLDSRESRCIVGGLRITDQCRCKERVFQHFGFYGFLTRASGSLQDKHHHWRIVCLFANDWRVKSCGLLSFYWHFVDSTMWSSSWNYKTGRWKCQRVILFWFSLPNNNFQSFAIIIAWSV